MLAQAATPSTLQYRAPTAEDGIALHALIKNCPPLDENSRYCNLLQCTHFAQTSGIAEARGKILGAVTGYFTPENQDTWFIWQIAVHQDARGQSISRHLIEHILKRKSSLGIRFIETTITQSNEASWAVFEKLAQQLDAAITKQPLFDHQNHFDGQQPSETLVRIGPLFELNAKATQQQDIQ